MMFDEARVIGLPAGPREYSPDGSHARRDSRSSRNRRLPPCRASACVARRVRLAASLGLACALLAATSASHAETANVENAVVKVFATARYPDPFRPWTKPSPTEVTGSGVVFDGKRILTNAHVVLYASEIQIQANQGGDRLSAKVEAVAPGIDLALLRLDDEKFFASHVPIARADALPQIKDAVLAYGFPTGGETLSITKGIVSRIEFVPYNYPVAGLRVQIDAAINAGNSGGPAVVGDKMVGLAFSRLGNAENIGYIIPNEEIDLFVNSAATGRYSGKPAIFDEFQTLENPALRRYLKLDDSVQGVIVSEPYPAGSAHPLKQWDVVTRIGSTPIDDQGMVSIGPNLHVNFRYLAQKLATSGKVPLTIVRAGKTMEVQLPVQSELPMLIPDLHGDYPPYFIYGPLVFSKATLPFLLALNKRPELMNILSAIGSPLVTQRSQPPRPEREELVLISSPMFPHKLTTGYSSHVGAILYSVNGTPVRSLHHLVELLRDLQDESVVLKFDGRGIETLVLPRKDIVAATEEILTDNAVRAQGSPDVMAIWQAAARH
jgi:S1-C subfamily serine protease